MKIRTLLGGGAAILAASAGLALAQAEAVPQSADARIVRVQDDGGVTRGPVTNLPVPRYVSLKGSEGNARRGPSLSHRIDWVFRHAGMPLRVVAEFGHWRRVEDKDGAGGWVHYALLSGVRTALVTQDMVDLRSRPDADSDVVARAEMGAIVRLGECTPGWCRISGGGQRGWVPKAAIWGVDPDEVRD
ncbi:MULTISPECIES: SH3 domain-containing protein [Paracoccus]|uniref:SH3 domain-containing protein n=1 Tax=Paracoccus fontiphilus TaxID=1815556 RepID=A0ABV7IBF6_9RHOB|nr:SH3 domain-containing protein [Paracoccus fontiphilus]